MVGWSAVAAVAALMAGGDAMRVQETLQFHEAFVKRAAGSAMLATSLALGTSSASLAAEPSKEALAIVQAALEASGGPDADALLGRAIGAWKTEKLPSDELAGLYKLRADAYARSL